MANNFEEVLRLVVKTEGDSEVGKLAQSVLELGKAGDVSEEQMRGLVDEVSKLAEAQNAVKSISALKAALQETGDKLFLAKRGLADLNSQFDKTDDSSGKISIAFRKAEKAVADLSTQERLLEIQLAKANGIVAKHGLDVEKLAEADQKLKDQAQGAAESLKGFATQSGAAASNTSRLESVTSKLGSAFASARSGLNSFASGLLRITGIAAGISAALAALNVGRLFGNSVESATNFESALSQVRAVSSATAEQLARMKQAAEDASKTTTFSALEAANALGELARASGDADSAISLLGPTLNLAQAAGIGAAESAGLLTTTLTQFGLAAEDATRVVDLLAREANSTQDTVTDLGNALSYAAPLARQLGVSLEETTAILGAMADQGFRGERAGTALRNTFQQLIDPASKFRVELNTLGIKGNDFTDIITKLAAAGKKSEAALLALGDRAGPAITALVTNGGAGIKRLIEDFRNAAGEAERTAKIMGENFAGASSRLASAFDLIRRSLVEPILEPLGRQFDAVAIKIRGFAESAQFEKIKKAVTDFVLGATDALIKFIASVNFDAVAAKIEEFVTNAKAFFKDFSDSVGAVGTTLSVIGNTIGIVFNTIQTAILGVAAIVSKQIALLVKGLSLGVEAFDLINQQVGRHREEIEKLNEVYGGLNAVSDEFAQRASDNAGEIKDSFNGLVGALTETKDAANQTNAAIEESGNTIKLTAEQVAEAKRQYDALPPALQALVEPGLRAAGVFSSIAEASASAEGEQKKFTSTLEKAHAATSAAYNEVSKLSGAGDKSSEAFNKAKASYDAAAAAEAKLTGASIEATKEATELAAAQGRLGKTQAELSANATQAGNDLDLLYKKFLSGSGAIEDVRASFDLYAAALRASVENSDSWRKSQVENIIAVKAAALGISEIKGPDFKPGTTKPLTDGLQQVSQQSTQAAEGLQKVGEKADETAQGVSSAAQAIQNIYAGFANELGKTSDAAVQRFTTLTRSIFELSAGIADFSGLARFGKAAEDAYNIVLRQVELQKAGVQDLAGEYANLSDSALANLTRIGGGSEQAAASLAQIAEEARNGRSEFDLLGAQDLSGLAAAADAAAAKVRQIGEEAKAAKEQLQGIADSLNDELDRIRGNDAAIEQRRFENQIENIRRLAEESGNLGSSEFNEAIRRANELHALKLKQIADEKKARGAAESGSGSASSSSSGTQGQGSNAPAPQPAPRPNTNATPRPAGAASGFGSGNTFNFYVNGRSDEELARKIKKIIDDIDRRRT